ncbi:protoheme IX farnesyltransferase [Kineococcus radiotolerans]|uniref:Protoheme IX farnesyltransferase n=1 Tax=Kineococcus radiotolerans TaxID=131568 RepID=A0A7W4XYA1_KINRA|nr:heme o synthase [Kineococcus radiotolerans]MBB2902941.1 protoheme IX farnesyltransferase [Kineococcus radiotolerans]
MTVADPRLTDAPAHSRTSLLGRRRGGRPPRFPRAAAYVALTKPRIVELLLITTIPVMLFAAGGLPSGWLILTTFVGGALAAGCANTLNCYFDRDIDALMKRTENRPLVTGEVSPRQALVFATVLGIASTAIFVAFVNVLSAALALGAILLYVVGYTLLLKRRTSQNIVWGGVAGCMQVLIGWTAVRDSLDWAPFVLFGVIFLWTPPHYWPLSVRYREDYANAGVPMLPVVAKPTTVSRQIVLYTIAMVLCSLLLVPLGGAGVVYGAAALVLGIGFLVQTIGLHRRATRFEVETGGRDAGTPEQLKRISPMGVFHGSITYLTLLSAAVAVDPFVRVGWPF